MNTHFSGRLEAAVKSGNPRFRPYLVAIELWCISESLGNSQGKIHWRSESGANNLGYTLGPRNSLGNLEADIVLVLFLPLSLVHHWRRPVYRLLAHHLLLVQKGAWHGGRAGARLCSCGGDGLGAPVFLQWTDVSFNSFALSACSCSSPALCKLEHVLGEVADTHDDASNRAHERPGAASDGLEWAVVHFPLAVAPKLQGRISAIDELGIDESTGGQRRQFDVGTPDAPDSNPVGEDVASPQSHLFDGAQKAPGAVQGSRLGSDAVAHYFGLGLHLAAEHLQDGGGQIFGRQLCDGNGVWAGARLRNHFAPKQLVLQNRVRTQLLDGAKRIPQRTARRLWLFRS